MLMTCVAQRSVKAARSREVLSSIARVLFIATLLLMLIAPPSDARGERGHRGGRHHHGHGRHVVVGVGAWWWGPPYPYWYYPRWYYPAYPYGYYPSGVVEESLQYIERAPEPSASWYYCPSASAYYPDTATCPEPWIQVPPRQE